MNRVLGVDGYCLVGECVEAKVDGLGVWRESVSLGIKKKPKPKKGERGVGRGTRTPLTMRVPTRVIVPFTISFRGVLSTNVQPGSIGARSA